MSLAAERPGWWCAQQVGLATRRCQQAKLTALSGKQSKKDERRKAEAIGCKLCQSSEVECAQVLRGRTACMLGCAALVAIVLFATLIMDASRLLTQQQPLSSTSPCVKQCHLNKAMLIVWRQQTDKSTIAPKKSDLGMNTLLNQQLGYKVLADQWRG